MLPAHKDQPSPRFVSTFLSHSSIDKPLVEAVAQHLGRYGVLAWLDEVELNLGPLDIGLKRAAQQQATMTIFLSEAAIASDWCRDELHYALEAGMDANDLLPVYLGNPLELVLGHPLLKRRFLHRDGDRVNQLGVIVTALAHPDPKTIAEHIAAAAYRRVIRQPWADVMIYLDHRGDGPRSGAPQLPPNFEGVDLPVLTFRTSRGPRQKRDTLSGDKWRDLVDNVKWSLSTALGPIRGGDPRKVRILGSAQTSLWWVIGQHFDRTTTADVYGYGRDDLPVTNRQQERLTPLSGGNPNSATLISGALSGKCLEIALGVGTRHPYVIEAQRSVPASVPFLWLDTGRIENSDQAMNVVADVVAVVQHLRQNHNVERVKLFWTSAAHVALLAATNLTSHVIRSIEFMEWDHDRGSYECLPLH